MSEPGLLDLLACVHEPDVLLPGLEAWAARRCGLAGVRLHLLSDDGRRLQRFGPDAGEPLGLHEQLAGRVASRGVRLVAADGAGRQWTAVPVRVSSTLVAVLEGTPAAGAPAGTAAGGPAAEALADAARQAAPLLAAARRWRHAASRLAAAERFAERAIAAQEAERARLAREIHDGVAQRLAGLGFQLSAAASLCGVDAEGSRAAITAARRLADLAGAEARAAIGDLRPPVLDDLGLAAALASLARDAGSAPGGPEVTVTVTGQLEAALPDHVQTALYRIAQECLSNAVRHARASAVDLTLSYGTRWVHLSVEDDGQGFVLDGGRAVAGRPDSFGLRSMRERAELLGGAVQIASRPGVGTTIRAAVPTPPPTRPPPVIKQPSGDQAIQR